MNNQITYEDVARAAEQLMGDGRPIGPTKVRQVLGRGSFTTVQKFLAEWEAEQMKHKATADEERRNGPPEGLLADLQKTMVAYWPQAVLRAKEGLRPEIEVLEGRLLESAARNKEATLEIGNLENKLEAVLIQVSRLEAAEKRALEANEKIIAIQAELSRLGKIEARFESQKEVIQNLQDQVAAGRAQAELNATLITKTEALNFELSEERIKVAKLETKLELLVKD